MCFIGCRRRPRRVADFGFASFRLESVLQMHIADIYTHHICACVCACWCVCAPVGVCVICSCRRSCTPATDQARHTCSSIAPSVLPHAPCTMPLPYLPPLPPPASFPVPTPRFKRGWHWRRLLGASVGVIVLCCSLRYAVAACCMLHLQRRRQHHCYIKRQPAASCTPHAARCKLQALGLPQSSFSEAAMPFKLAKRRRLLQQLNATGNWQLATCELHLTR